MKPLVKLGVLRVLNTPSLTRGWWGWVLLGVDGDLGDADEEAAKLGVLFDMAFIDGDKRTYRQTYETVLSLLNRGGFIVADNTLWDGHVIDQSYDRDPQTRGIESFNDFLMHDDRVEQVILPLRDGLTLIRKR
jgi:predicted O-methyltransferase YrrM